MIGCEPGYTPECLDKSDAFVCPATKCLGNEEFYPCVDNKYCIHVSLVCDGYAQCEDSSGILTV